MQAGKCTWKRGSRGIPQKMYHCRTCGLVGDLGICEECAKRCHAGHAVFEVPGISVFNCNCGGESGKRACKCVPNNTCCTNKRIGTNLSQQHVWYCKTCRMPLDEGICNVCAEKCHAGHELVDKGIWYSFTCYCGKGNTKCEAKSVIFDEIPQSPSYGMRLRSPSPADGMRPPSNESARIRAMYDRERISSGNSPRHTPIASSAVSVISSAHGSRPRTPPKAKPHVTFVGI